MSRQTICDRCARVIDDSNGSRWHLTIERTEMWNDVSFRLNFCADCVTDVLYPKITEFMKEYDIASEDEPAEVIEEVDGE